MRRLANRKIASMNSTIGMMIVAFGMPLFAENEASEADKLFREGRNLLDAGKIDEACDQFEKSLKIDHALGTLLNLALCREKQGRLASALLWFREARLWAAERKEKDREALAGEHIAAIEPKVPKILISVPKSTLCPDLEIFRNGVIVPPKQWDTAIPVDDGVVIIQAVAPLKEPWQKAVEPQVGTITRIKIPALDSKELNEQNKVVATIEPHVENKVQNKVPGAKMGNKESKAPGQVELAPYEPTVQTEVSYKKIIGYALLGTGIVSVGMTAYFGLKAKNEWHDSGYYCDVNNVCSKEGVDLSNSARIHANTATVTAITAGASLLAGGILWLLGSDSSQAGSGERTAIGWLVPFHMNGIWGAGIGWATN